MTTKSLPHRRMRVVAALTACAVVASGCSGTTNVTSHLPGGYLSDSDDFCYAQRRQLDSSGSTFNDALVVNTVGGAIVGGIIAAATDGNIATGVLLGAAAGAAGTYLNRFLKNRNGNTELAVRDVINEIQVENARIDTLLRNFDAVRDCRRTEADAVRARFKGGQIDEATALAEMNGIRGRYLEDVNHTRKIAANISKRSGEYATVYNYVAADNNQPGLEVSPPPAIQETTRSGGTQQRRKPRREPSAKLTSVPPKKDPESRPVSASEEVVKDHRDATSANVEKRDQVYDRIATANAEEDEIFDLS